MSVTMLDLTNTDTLDNALVRAHAALAQSHLPPSQRSLTARNYDSSIKRLSNYLFAVGEPLPTRSVLERWRDDMLRGGLAVRTVNARLAAARKLLNTVAADSTDIQTKLVLADWAKVADAKATYIQDKTERDYGRRLTLDSLAKLVNSIPLKKDKGYRDRALIAVMGGAGLRVSEAVALTMRDVFLTTNEAGQRGVKIRRGKHNKSRVVVLNSWNSWVIEAVQAYTSRVGLSPEQDMDETVFGGVDRFGKDTGQWLSERGGQRAVEAYEAEYQGQMVRITAHDLRRTYAKLCKSAGMSWEALRENMGHSSVKITEDYVGHDVDWSERMPNWTITLQSP
jgi:site-specific recombinase XerD